MFYWDIIIIIIIIYSLSYKPFMFIILLKTLALHEDNWMISIAIIFTVQNINAWVFHEEMKLNLKVEFLKSPKMIV